MWLDGSYLCKCYTHGIECTVDRVLADNLLHDNPDWSNPFHAECVKNNPHNCVCGLDGVPSCTAKAIDRSSHPNAKTFILPAPVPFSPRTIAPQDVYYQQRNGVQHKTRLPDGSSSEPRYIQHNEFYPSRHAVFRRDLRRDFPKDNFRDGDNTRTSPFWYIDNLIRRQEKYLDFYDFYENYFHRSNSRQDFRDTSSTNLESEEGGQKNNYLSENSETETLPGVYGYAPVYKDYNWEPEVGSKDYKRPSVDRRGRSRHEKTRGDGLVYDEPKTFKQSVVAVSDDRCRFGVRWYGGSLRCYCDNEDGSISCGDPSFVALTIDVFRLKGANCDEGQWHDPQRSCLHCECLTHNVLQCGRSELCPLPLLIGFNTEDLENFNDRKDLEHNTGEFKGQDVENLTWDFGHGGRSSKLNPADDHENKPTAVDKDLDEVDSPISSGEADGSGEVKPAKNVIDGGDLEPPHEFVDKRGTVSSTKKPNKKPNGNKTTTPTSEKINRGKPNVPDSKATTFVIIQDCKPGRVWTTGCKRCTCSAAGKKICDESKCKNGQRTTSTTTSSTSTTTTTTSTPSTTASTTATSTTTTEATTSSTSTTSPPPSTTTYRRPRPKPKPEPKSVLPVVRDGPVVFKSLFDARPCGRFNESEHYWVDCNICICTKQGPKCTAQSCL